MSGRGRGGGRGGWGEREEKRGERRGGRGRDWDERGGGGGGGKRDDKGGRDRGERRGGRGGGRGFERGGEEKATTPSRDGAPVFKIYKNAERERADQQRQLEQEFPALAPVTLASPSRDESEGGPAVAGILLKTREEGSKRSESPMVARPVSLGRRDSATIPTPKIKQAVKLVDENAVFCDSISEFMTDNQDFLVIGVCGLQVRESLICPSCFQTATRFFLVTPLPLLKILILTSLTHSECWEKHLDQCLGTCESRSGG